MLECPVCDFAKTDNLWTILDRIDNPDLIINLACDFAARVRDISPNPLETDRWLDAARNWRSDRAAADASASAARVAAEKATGPFFSSAAWAVWQAVSAVGEPRVTKARTAAADAATARIDASGVDWAAEREWQQEHTCELACTCVAILTARELGTRSRNSLLAS